MLETRKLSSSVVTRFIASHIITWILSNVRFFLLTKSRYLHYTNSFIEFHTACIKFKLCENAGRIIGKYSSRLTSGWSEMPHEEGRCHASKTIKVSQKAHPYSDEFSPNKYSSSTFSTPSLIRIKSPYVTPQTTPKYPPFLTLVSSHKASFIKALIILCLADIPIFLR